LWLVQRNSTKRIVTKSGSFKNEHTSCHFVHLPHDMSTHRRIMNRITSARTVTILPSDSPRTTSTDRAWGRKAAATRNGRPKDFYRYAPIHAPTATDDASITAQNRWRVLPSDPGIGHCSWPGYGSKGTRCEATYSAKQTAGEEYRMTIIQESGLHCALVLMLAVLFDTCDGENER